MALHPTKPVVTGCSYQRQEERRPASIRNSENQGADLEMKEFSGVKQGISPSSSGTLYKRPCRLLSPGDICPGRCNDLSFFPGVYIQYIKPAFKGAFTLPSAKYPKILLFS
jgi:hypothetical protein